VLTITRNLTIDALRMRRAIPTDPDDFAASALLSLEHNPEDAVQRGDVRAMVRAALSTLPPEQRRAVVLAAVYGRTPSRSAKKKAFHWARRRPVSGPGLSASAQRWNNWGMWRKDDE
jgi:DNA-directed RNA polymerase specialized sigma24 family protein